MIAVGGDAARGGGVMAVSNRRCRFRFNLFLGLSFLLFAISASEGTARSQPSALPAAAGAAVDVEGEFVIIHEDFKHSGRYLYFLNTPSGQVPLYFKSKPPTNLLTGAHVRAHGTVDQSGTLILASGGSVTTLSTATTSSTAPLPNTFGAQSTAVILVNFQDAPTNQPWTPAQVQSVVFGSSGANGFMQENSYGQMWLTGNVFGWYTMALSSTTCNSFQIAGAANNAATAAGVNLSVYTRYVYVFPTDSGCGGWSGAAQIGGAWSWMNGNIDPKVFAHELGHNLGLYHSHGLYCGGTSSIGAVPPCTLYEYGDPIDTMGGGAGDYNAFQKERLGWLNYGSLPPITTVTASGTYTLDLYEPTGSSPKGLKIIQSVDATTGLRTWYYLEYRQAISFDSFISAIPFQNFTNGVTVHTGTDSSPNSSDFLDMTPGSNAYDFNDGALVPGASFTDPNAGVTITTAWINATNAGVSVTLTTPCTHANPTVVISPASSAPASAGIAVIYTVSITNNDNYICKASSFNLAATVASGWSAALAGTPLTLNPGASGSTSLAVTSPISAAAGLYSVSDSAQNTSVSGYAGSASATYEVAPSVTVSTNSSSYNQGNSIYVTTVVKSGGSSVPGTSVNSTVTAPDGTKMSATATTGTNGTTSATFKLKRNAPPGIYWALSVAAANGVSGSGATNFTV